MPPLLKSWSRPARRAFAHSLLGEKSVSKPFINKALRRSALTVALGLCFASGVHAQSNTTGNIVGHAQAGSTVVVSNPTTGFSREITVGADGTYRAGALPPGTYTVTLRGADGSASVRNGVSVAVGAGTSVDFVGPAPADDAVELDAVKVTANYVAPIDFSSVESTTIVTQETIERLPVSREVTSVALLAPGTTQGDAGFGNLASFGGATVGENAYYINGFNVTNFRNGLGFSNVPFDMYSQYQVKTGGYGAEFGRSTGGVINATTKRGSNEWHWGASAYWTPDRWRQSDRDIVNRQGEAIASNRFDEYDKLEASMYASGPLIKDRLFFYAIGSMRDNSQTTHGFTGDLETKGPATDGSTDSPFWGLKLDAYLTDNHRIEYTGFRDESEFITTGRRTQAAALPGEIVGYEGETSYAQLSGGDNHILKYTGYLSDSFTLSALWGQGEYSVSDYNSGISANANSSYVTYNSLLGPTRVLTPALGSLNSLGEDKRVAYRVDAEWDLGDIFLGSHFLRFGIDREENSAVNNNTIQGADGYRYAAIENDGDDNVIGTADDFWYVQRDVYKNIGDFETLSQAFYVEDQWQVTNNLLLSIGVRNEQFENMNAGGEAFIKIKDQWAPRLGLSWDIGGAGTQKVFANAGRYHLPVATNTNIRLAGQELYLRDLFFWDGTSVDENYIPILDPANQFRASVFADGSVHPTESSVDQEIDPMYQDEFILGYQWQFLPKWSVGIRGIYRELGSTIEDMAVDAGLNRYIEQNGIAPSVDCDGDDVAESVGCGFDYYVLGNPGFPITIQVDIDGDGDLDPVELSADVLGYPKSVRKYKALEVFFARAWDNQWFLEGSYTWANSYGNNEGFVRSDNEQTDAGLTTLFDQPGLMDGAYGDLPNDRTHTVKVWGAWKFAPEFQLSGNYVGKSGRPINCFGFHPTDLFAQAYGQESFYCNGELVERGSVGRTGWTNQLDLGLEYRPMWAEEKLAFKIDMINVLGDQEVTELNEVGDLSQVPTYDADDNFTGYDYTANPNYLSPTNFQQGRSVRLSVSYDW